MTRNGGKNRGWKGDWFRKNEEGKFEFQGVNKDRQGRDSIQNIEKGLSPYCIKFVHKKKIEQAGWEQSN